MLNLMFHVPRHLKSLTSEKKHSPSTIQQSFFATKVVQPINSRTIHILDPAEFDSHAFETLPPPLIKAVATKSHPLNIGSSFALRIYQLKHIQFFCQKLISRNCYRCKNIKHLD